MGENVTDAQIWGNNHGKFEKMSNVLYHLRHMIRPIFLEDNVLKIPLVQETHTAG